MNTLEYAIFHAVNNFMLNSSRLYEVFSNILLDNFLTQMVLEPTRGNNILDLVLSNTPDCIYDAEVGEPFSDHNTVSFKINLNPYWQKRTNKQFIILKKPIGLS